MLTSVAAINSLVSCIALLCTYCIEESKQTREYYEWCQEIGDDLEWSEPWYDRFHYNELMITITVVVGNIFCFWFLFLVPRSLRMIACLRNDESSCCRIQARYLHCMRDTYFWQVEETFEEEIRLMSQ